MGMSISNYTFRKLAIQLKINLCKFHTKSVKDDKLPIVFTFRKCYNVRNSRRKREKFGSKDLQLRNQRH